MYFFSKLSRCARGSSYATVSLGFITEKRAREFNLVDHGGNATALRVRPRDVHDGITVFFVSFTFYWIRFTRDAPPSAVRLCARHRYVDRRRRKTGVTFLRRNRNYELWSKKIKSNAIKWSRARGKRVEDTYFWNRRTSYGKTCQSDRRSGRLFARPNPSRFIFGPLKKKKTHQTVYSDLLPSGNVAAQRRNSTSASTVRVLYDVIIVLRLTRDKGQAGWYGVNGFTIRRRRLSCRAAAASSP
jgi:hypothetical protein